MKFSDTLMEVADRFDRARRVDWPLAEGLFGKDFTRRVYQTATKTKQGVDLSALWFLEQAARQAPVGPTCEVGVWRGQSAASLAKVRGGELWLVDSFEGLSYPSTEDCREIDEDGQRYASQGPGGFPTSVARVFETVPSAKIIKGWVPEALSGLPDQEWAFVHLDLDLYEPTLEALKYFLSRMIPGGIIVEDDYASFRFPGSGRAWDFHGTKLDVLPTGQGVYRHADH